MYMNRITSWLLDTAHVVVILVKLFSELTRKTRQAKSFTLNVVKFLSSLSAMFAAEKTANQTQLELGFFVSYTPLLIGSPG
ncbi:hypothetical protein ECV0102_02200 [Enterobacter cloacae]|nr:hypothetical protein ECV0102_02200 [Enterobacter cloacae]